MMGSRDRSRSPAGALSIDEILRMITQREHARQAKDFGQADSIRETLRGSGVEVFDKTMNWRAQDGRTGRIPTFQEIESGAALQGSGGSALSTQEIVSLIFQRETARKANDYAQADSIREQLKAGGVELFDKKKHWTATDGRSGTMPAWQEIEAGSSIDHHVERVQDGMLSIDPNDPLSGVKQLVMQRETARSAKDYQEADRIREELRQQSVEIFDKEKLWKRTSDGAAGVVIGYREDGTCTDQEIQILVLQRERARQEKQWPVSDMIRDELRLRGVAVFDKEKSWRANDGRQGAVPVWNGTNAVVMQPMPAMAPMMHHRTPAYAPHSVPTAFAGGARANNLQTLQNQIVQEALRHAQNPAAAQQTLQRLRSGGGGARMQVTGPTSSRPVKAEPTPSASPDVRDALTFCQNNQGRALAEDEIMWLLETRERCRSMKDFASADSLRGSMKSMGLELMDKQKIWTTTDGRSGPLPAWESLK